MLTPQNHGWNGYVLVVLMLLGAEGVLARESAREPLATWTVTRLDEQAQEWIRKYAKTSEQNQQWEQVWRNSAEKMPLLKLIELFCAADRDTQAAWDAVVRDMAEPTTLGTFQRSEWGELYVANLSLGAAQLLSERRDFDGVLQLLEGVSASAVVEPAQFLFLKATAAQALQQHEGALDAAQRLLGEAADAPGRYQAVARLLVAELEGRKENPLQDISGLMSDSERRLDLGAAGEKVQGVQQTIIDKLNDVIKKLEEQQQQQQQQASQSQSPAGGTGGDASQTSRVKGEVAPGETDAKKLSKAGNWGNLPEKEATRARNLINRTFPPHYSDAIEKYSRKLANRPGKP